MRYMISLMILLCSISVHADTAHFSTPSRNQLKIINKIIGSDLDYQGAKFKVLDADLNDDGYPELIVRTEHCPEGKVLNFFIWGSKNGHSDHAGYLIDFKAITILPDTHNGMHNLSFNNSHGVYHWEKDENSRSGYSYQPKGIPLNLISMADPNLLNTDIISPAQKAIARQIRCEDAFACTVEEGDFNGDGEQDMFMIGYDCRTPGCKGGIFISKQGKYSKRINIKIFYSSGLDKIYLLETKHHGMYDIMLNYSPYIWQYNGQEYICPECKKSKCDILREKIMRTEGCV